MIKPWLLSSEEERKERIEIYNNYIKETWPLIDEGIEIILRPPRNKLDALFELYMYQLVDRKNRGYRK